MAARTLISVRIGPSWLAQVKVEAAGEGKSVSAMIRLLLWEALTAREAKR